MRRLLPALILLSACGGTPDSANEAAVMDGATVQEDATAAALASTGDASAMTLIDAATGDAARMPEDFTGPTAGEIAARARDREAAARSAMERALDAAQNLDVDLPDPMAGGVMGGESAVVETQ